MKSRASSVPSFCPNLFKVSGFCIWLSAILWVKKVIVATPKTCAIYFHIESFPASRVGRGFPSKSSTNKKVLFILHGKLRLGVCVEILLLRHERAIFVPTT